MIDIDVRRSLQAANSVLVEAPVGPSSRKPLVNPDDDLAQSRFESTELAR